MTWYDSAIWGQVDAFGALFSLATVALLIDGHAEGATAMAVVAALAKPQYGVVLVPVVAVVLLRRHLLLPGSGPRVHDGPRWYRTLVRPRNGRLAAHLVGGRRRQRPVPGRRARSAWTCQRLIVQYGKAAGTYPYLTVNALNPWALVGVGDQPAMAEAGFGRWPPDTVPLLGPVPGVLIGTAHPRRRLRPRPGAPGPSRRSRRHPARGRLPLPRLLRPADPRPRALPLPRSSPSCRCWRSSIGATWWPRVALSLAAFIGLHGVLSTPFWATPNIEDFFFGPDFRSYPVLLLSIVLTTSVFLFLLWRVLRATAEPEEPLALQPWLEDTRPTAGGAASLGAPATATDAGALGAVTDAPWLEEVRPRPRPPDRRATGAGGSGALP